MLDKDWKDVAKRLFSVSVKTTSDEFEYKILAESSGEALVNAYSLFCDFGSNCKVKVSPCEAAKT